MFILTTKILSKLNTYAQYLNLEEMIVVNLLLSLGYVRGLSELVKVRSTIALYTNNCREQFNEFIFAKC